MEKEIEYNNIVADIIRNDKFISLKDENHHGITRLDHSLNVAKMAFKIAKKLKFKDIETVTRAALLHDFYVDEEMEGKFSLYSHPKVASINAKNYFNISKKEVNAIEAHMFPMSQALPKCKEAWIVTLSDKMVAIYEMFRYKAPLKAGTYLFLLVNFLTMPIYPK